MEQRWEQSKRIFFLAAYEHKHQVVRSCDMNTVCTCSVKVVVGTGMVEEHASFESQMTSYAAPLHNTWNTVTSSIQAGLVAIPESYLESFMYWLYQLYSTCIKQWRLNKNIIIGYKYIPCDCDPRVVSYTMYWPTTRAFPEAALMHRYCHEDSVDI